MPACRHTRKPLRAKKETRTGRSYLYVCTLVVSPLRHHSHLAQSLEWLAPLQLIHNRPQRFFCTRRSFAVGVMREGVRACVDAGKADACVDAGKAIPPPGKQQSKHKHSSHTRVALGICRNNDTDRLPLLPPS
jgi:hypothetical protein